ncbi:MAG: response regulator [Cuspidothrix sp.]
MMYPISRTIIVIDHDDTSRNFVLYALESKGYSAIGAENGLMGVELTKKFLPDLVISDLVMPEMDGYTVLSELREDPLTAIIPFIFLTNINSKTSWRKAMEWGADDYLTKPVQRDELLRAIAIRLEKQALLRYWYTTNSHPGLLTESPTTSINSQSIFPNLPHLQKIFDYIEANYHKGITLSDVAGEVGYSQAYLTNQVAKQTGKPINVWIVKRRMIAARSLLENTNQTVEEIAGSLGYQNSCHFSRQFRQHHGLSPANWRKKHQLNPDAKHIKLPLLKNIPESAISGGAGRN